MICKRTGLLVGIIFLVAAGSTHSATHEVDVRNVEFVPGNLIIEVGDSVHWTWVEGTHTVTSGPGSSDPQAGDLFDTPLQGPGSEFGYRFNEAGQFPYFCRPHESLGMTGNITVEAPSGILDAEDDVPDGFFLGQNHPNPFNPETVISFSLETGGKTTLIVYNLLGQRVSTIVDGFLQAGSHQVTWDSRDRTGELVPSGMYLYRLQSGEVNATRKMVIVR